MILYDRLASNKPSKERTSILGKECRKWVYKSMLHHFSQVIGGNNVADSITAIRKVVFEDKKVTLPELIKIMDKNWEGPTGKVQ